MFAVPWTKFWSLHLYLCQLVPAKNKTQRRHCVLRLTIFTPPTWRHFAGTQCSLTITLYRYLLLIPFLTGCIQTDYIEFFRFSFQLKNGVVRCIFRLAGRTKILKLPGLNVTDNKYHTIIVQRFGNYATLQVDYAGKVEGSTGGTNHLMNHGGGALFAGKVLNRHQCSSRKGIDI